MTIKLSILKSFMREVLTSTAWWAPLAVIFLHRAVMWMGVRSQSDGLVHASGGFAITLFIWTLIPILEKRFGAISLTWRYLVTFFAGCSTALVWDLIEFASDEILNTSIQHSLRETMLDLSYGFAGVTLMTVILLVKQVTKRA